MIEYEREREEREKLYIYVIYSSYDGFMNCFIFIFRIN